MKKLTCEIVIEREEDPKAGYSVYCPDLPGCFSNGGSVAEAKKNMREAIGLHLESLIELGDYLDLTEARVRDEGQPRLTHNEAKKRYGIK